MQTRTVQILASLLFLTTAISSCDKKEVSSWDKMVEVNNQIVSPVFPDRTFVITDYHDVKDTLYRRNRLLQYLSVDLCLWRK